MNIFAYTDREAATFVLVAQLCNFISDNYTASDGYDFTNTPIRPNMATLLTGERIIDNKSSNISYTGILDAIGIHYEPIREFYAKFKKK